MIFNQVDDAVQAAVNCAAVFGFAAEILPQRAFLIICNVQSVFHKFFNALAFCRRNRHDRYTQHLLHAVDVDAAAVCGEFIHHIEGNNHRDIHFEELHREVEIALNVRHIDDIDDCVGLFVQHEIARNDLLAAVRGHRIDAGQIGHHGFRMLFDCAVFAVNGDTGEIADVLP